MKITAPFTDAQVTALNAWQRSGRFHPFTCGAGDRRDAAHTARQAAFPDEDFGQLVADADGWHCPACGYRQVWAHDFMAAPMSVSRQTGGADG